MARPPSVPRAKQVTRARAYASSERKAEDPAALGHGGLMQEARHVRMHGRHEVGRMRDPTSSASSPYRTMARRCWRASGGRTLPSARRSRCMATARSGRTRPRWCGPSHGAPWPRAPGSVRPSSRRRPGCRPARARTGAATAQAQALDRFGGGDRPADRFTRVIGMLDRLVKDRAIASHVEVAPPHT